MIPAQYHLPMKLITRDTDYAVRALVYMTRDPDRLTSAQELVDALKMPRAFSRRILQVLSRKGILESAKGKGGGFILKRSPRQIRLFDLMEAFQGRLSAVGCLFKKKVCPGVRTCPLRGRVKNIEKKIFSDLQAITIASLANGGKR